MKKDLQTVQKRFTNCTTLTAKQVPRTRKKLYNLSVEEKLKNPVFCPNSFYELEVEPHPGSLFSSHGSKA
jgi:hypothetical protein